MQAEVDERTAAEHGLTAGEYQRITDRIGRVPTLTELGILSVMWSEHCSYKSSRLHLKKLPTSGERILVGPGENAGIVDIGGGWAAAFKIESHNHPSYIEPFQGAATGVGGILRDIFTMGARPVAVLDALRFGPPDDPQDGPANRRIIRGVVEGIAHYGNCIGVPTIGGECSFDPCFSANPLVNVFALGVFRQDSIFLGSAKGLGNPVIYVGAKTGRDGIQGASMASAEFDEDSEAKRPNVQVGDPFLEKLLLEACLEAMRTGAILGIQDMGAAGLTCSTAEMGGRGGVGIEIELDRVPQRESGMTPYEIMLSESQERMLLVAERGREGEVLAVFRKWGLDAVEIGTVTADRLLRVKHGGSVVAELDTGFLSDDAPLYDRPHTAPRRTAPLDGPVLNEPSAAGLRAGIEALLASPDLNSKRWIWEQYDHQVRTNTTSGPGADAAVIRIKEANVSLAMSLDGNSRYCALDPRLGTQLIVAECCRNLATVGATPIAATNNLNFGNPEKPEIMAQLVESIEGMAQACRHFGTPITGGNVSLYNETLGEGIDPAPVLGIVGILDHMAAPIGSCFTQAGDLVVLLGGLLPDCRGEELPRRFGSSQYAKTVLGQTWGLPPSLDLEQEAIVHEATRSIVRQNLAHSAHDVGSGGLAVALAECCFGPKPIGATVEFETNHPLLYAMFHECPSRVLLSLPRANIEEVVAIAASLDVPLVELGHTGGSTLTFGLNAATSVEAPVARLRGIWESSFEASLETQ